MCVCCVCCVCVLCGVVVRVCVGGDEFSKRLQAEVKWVSSIDIYPGGEVVCVCVLCVCVVCRGGG